MAGSYLAGKAASVAAGGGPLAFRSWKCAMKAAALKINDFLSGGYQNLIAGFVSATINLAGAYCAGATPFMVGTIYTFTLSFSAGLNLTVPAMVTELTPNVEAEKEITLDLTAESSGAFTAAVT